MCTQKIQMLTVKVFPYYNDVQLPKFMSDRAAGADVYSREDVFISPFETHVFDLGFSVIIPDGYEIQVRTRSGMAFKKGMIVVNSPGTIDSDYRGECRVAIKNLNPFETYKICVGDRIAQFVLKKCYNTEYVAITENVFKEDITTRGDGGIGSTDE